MTELKLSSQDIILVTQILQKHDDRPGWYSLDFVLALCTGEVGSPGYQILALELLLVLPL